MQKKGFLTYPELHNWSVEEFPEFWQTLIEILKIHFNTPFTSIVDMTEGPENPKWLVDAKFNIVNSCFTNNPNELAIISQNEQGKWSTIRYSELERLSNRVANSLLPYLKPGEKAAIIMPMTITAVAIYLGIIKMGGVVVSIADSFSTEEIENRLKIANAQLVFTEDHINRDNKVLPLYEKIKAANAPRAIVIPKESATLTEPLRRQDRDWQDFLCKKEAFHAVICTPENPINILFSSGTTFDPKAIPWTQTTPIKCAADAYLHHNLHPKDIFCWPSNLGWMMGPWLIFAAFLNKATLALYEGSLNNKAFGQFVAEAKVTHLGVIPTLVKSWRLSACMENLEWSNLKLFTSTGECSNVEDMLYLMSLAKNCPVIEYCGGTEIGGAYISSTLTLPIAPATCNAKVLGLDFCLLDEQGKLTTDGEVALIPPSIGLSTELLNNDHHQIYYAGMPKLFKNKILRRHGDKIKHLPNGLYQILGRVDDALNLGGIKVSSAEIERVLNILPGIYETAAIGIEPKLGGPSQLIIYTVLENQGTPIKENEREKLKTMMQTALKQHLNPLFKISEVVVIATLPRTASNKIMRRVLRERYRKFSAGSPLSRG